MSLFWNGIVRMYRGELDLARAATQDLLNVTAQYRIPHLTVCGILLNGAITVAAGDSKSGLQQIQKALAEFRSLRGGLGMPWIMALAADACLRSDARLDAQAAAAMGLAMTNVHGERHWEAELHRIKGEALLATTGADSGEAEAAFRQAIDVAYQQKALSLELRASMSLARLLAARGERSNAAACVNDVYSRFTEGFATADLITAKALIDELNGAAIAIRPGVEVPAPLS
jgi:adenylate cyclase